MVFSGSQRDALMRYAYKTKRHSPKGYVAVTKLMARELWSKGCDVTFCGNNVNSYHVFGGWRLGYTSNKEYSERCFDAVCIDMLSYMEDELGRYLVYYVRSDAI
jgi:hypothetical protein